MIFGKHKATNLAALFVSNRPMFRPDDRGHFARHQVPVWMYWNEEPATFQGKPDAST